MVLSCGEKASLLVSLAVTNPYYSTYQLYTVYDPLCKYTSQTHIIFCFHDFVCSFTKTHNLKMVVFSSCDALYPLF